MNLSKKCGLFTMFIIVLFSRIMLPQEMVVTHCTGIDSNAFIRIEAPAIYTQLLSRGLLPTNDFIVDYDASVPNEMIAAFNKATEIWSCYLQMSKPVKIHVRREALGGTTLANTGTVTYRNSLPGLTANWQYPIALAKQLNSSITYDGYDMTIAFTTTREWECNLLGIPVADKFDFISIALHEIGHGLGFSSSMQLINNVGRYGYKNFPVDTGKYVEPFDVSLLSGTVRLYQMTDSTALGTILKSGNVVFDGANAKKANSETNVKIYAPSVWKPGSSINHLDDATYGFSNPSKNFLNAMMASATTTASVIHDPGPITMGILQDIGWTISRFIAF
ncbi:MAG: hypothetical protein HY965_01475, partial [Ignavibacteriales bacterium]|nr:hypothetical protein [Ignavibacteriales bacterium]